MIDLLPLYERVSASTLLPDSGRLLLEGFAEILDSNSSADVAAALRGLVRHPDDANHQLAWSALLTEALTRNTSHVPIDVRDEVGSLRANLIDRLDRLPDAAKEAHASGLAADLAKVNSRKKVRS